jgi:polysaccharide biosynthesis/export protein
MWNNNWARSRPIAAMSSRALDGTERALREAEQTKYIVGGGRKFRCIRQALLGGLVLLLGMTGCTASLPPLPAQTEPQPVAGLVQEQRQTTTGYTFGEGDVLRVSVYDQPDLSQEVTIEADGSFHYPLIGRVQAANLGVQQLETLLTQRLADGYVVSPQVGVTVAQHKSQQVHVMGAVKAPGAYPLRRQSTMLEMLSAAGGPIPEAGSEVMLVRAKDAQALSSDRLKTPAVSAGQSAIRLPLDQLLAGGVPQRITLQDGDVIYVPAGAFVYVTGEIQHPGRYHLERDTTVFKAITLAGGFTKFAAKKTMKVQRVVNGQRQEFQASTDDLLQAEDVVMVPASLF